MVSFLILNDIHPIEQPGAATVAFDFALCLSESYPTTFLYTSESDASEIVDGLKKVGVRRNTRKSFKGYTGQISNFLHDCFGFIEAVRFTRLIRECKTDVVWVHQIGNFIPRLTLYFLSKKTTVYYTLHDYGLIVPRKLYPSDLSIDYLNRLGVSVSNKSSNPKNGLTEQVRNKFYAFRRKILRHLLKDCNLIAISTLQSDIHQEFGFKITREIPNGIASCICESKNTPKEKKTVLFVGRLIGKGFHRLLSSAIREGFTVYLVGRQELLDSALPYGPELRFIYLGRLARRQIFDILHKVEFAYVASECFDVYPTFGIESIRHGAIPITSETTGIRDLVRYVNPTLVIRYDQEFVPLNRFNLDSSKGLFDLNQAARQLSTMEDAVNEFLSLNQIS